MDYTIQDVEEKRESSEGFFFDVGSLYECLSELKDKRKARGKRYKLVEVLMIFILAKLSGENKSSGIAEWAKLRTRRLTRALGIKRAQIPNRTTFIRVLGQAVDMEEFAAAVGKFLSRSVGEEVLINIDGKVMKGTIPSGKTQGVYLLAAYLPEEGIVLMQLEVGKKENEIVAAPKLLKCLDLRSKIVSGDAMFAQRKLSIQIVMAGGHYLWTVKGNQPTVLGDIARLFEPTVCIPGTSPMRDDFVEACTVEKKHGRLERRTITVSSMLQDYTNWPHLQQVFKLERTVLHLKTGEETHEVSYGVTSLPASIASPERLLHLTRRHWAIENELHYPRDVTFLEDQCRLSMGHAPQAMAIINNLVLGLIKGQDFDYAPQARRFYNARFQDALNLVLCA